MINKMKNLILAGGLASLVTANGFAENLRLERILKYLNPDQKCVDIDYMRLGNEEVIELRKGNENKYVTLQLSLDKKTDRMQYPITVWKYDKEKNEQKYKNEKFKDFIGPIEYFIQEDKTKNPDQALDIEDMIKIRQIYDKAKKKILVR